jgi:peptide/nickel transport system ATP-binding protein
LTKSVIELEDLHISYKTHRGDAKVVNGVNMYVNNGEKVGLVGESGCGKTTTMKAILQILDPDSIRIPSQSRIFFKGQNILSMNEDELQHLRRRGISMISQSPMSALNPMFSIGTQLMDIIKYSGEFDGKGPKEILDIAEKTLESVMLSDPERIMASYPHQLSGGMRQRVCIAFALVTPRDLLIADEPCTALDVTIQDQIHNMLRELVESKGRSLVMITHSLGVARELVDRIYIMYGGTIVENCYTRDLFKNPSHPYTKGLMDCVPRLYGGGLSTGIYGYIPDYVKPPLGCRFCPRCSSAAEICKNERPPMYEIEEGHQVACFLYSERDKTVRCGNEAGVS